MSDSATQAATRLSAIDTVRVLAWVEQQRTRDPSFWAYSAEDLVAFVK